MPPREGISIAQFLTVVDIDRPARFYEKVFGGRILSLEGHELRAAPIVPGITHITRGGPSLRTLE